MTSKKPHIIVIGAGIVGASIAYHLSKQQVKVTLIDKEVNDAKNATGKSFGWITGGFEISETYLHFRQHAIAEWHRLEGQLKGRLNIAWPGALTWHGSFHETERLVNHFTNFGYPVRLVETNEIKELEPNLNRVPKLAMFAKHEGAFDPVIVTNVLINAAVEAGVNIKLGNEVLSFITNGSHIEGVITAAGKVTADLVVVAAGINAITLCQTLGFKLPVNASPAILLTFDNLYKFVNHIVSAPFFELRFDSNTFTVAAEKYIDQSFENNPDAIARRTLERIKKHWQNTERMKLIEVSVRHRPVPDDGLPIIGRTHNFDNLYIAVMHAGVTLAAIVGRLASKEIIGGDENDLLVPYNLNRFSRLL